MKPLRRLLIATGTIVATLALLLVGAVQGFAQDQATPPPVVVSVVPHPAAIHQGTCAQPVDEPAYDFGDVGPPTKDGQPLAPEDIRGQITGPALMTATNPKMEFKMDDLLDSGQPYVVLIHESAQNFTTILACGEIGGPVLGNQLTVGLRPLNNSGMAGIAELVPDGDNTAGTIWMIPEVMSLSGGQQGTPVTQPTPTPGATFAPTATLGTVQGSPAAMQPTPTPTGVAAPATETPTPAS